MTREKKQKENPQEKATDEPADPNEGYPAFVKDRGFEKCGLPPGIGARIAAQIMIEDMEKEK